MNHKPIAKAPKTRRGVELHIKNPFMTSVETRTKRITNKRGDMMLVSNEGELISDVAGFGKVKR